MQIHGTYFLIDALGAATVNREGKGVRDWLGNYIVLIGSNIVFHLQFYLYI